MGARARTVAAIAAALFLGQGTVSVHAQQWAPERTVKIVVPFPPGGTGDALARLTSQQISQASGQAFLVEHRPGGGTVIATEAVARAPPDGTTLLIVANSFVINASLRTSLPYDPLTSFEPVCNLVYTPMALVVHKTSPLQTLADFVAAARVKPPALSIAAVGPATTHHMALEMMKRALGIDFNFVPFPGGAPAVNTITGNHVSAALANYHEVQESLGIHLRALAVSGDARLAGVERVPLFSDSGLGDVIATAWFGLVAPARTPAAVIEKMAVAFKAAIDAPAVMDKLKAVGLVKMGACGAEFATHLKTQHAQYARAIKEAGIKTE